MSYPRRDHSSNLSPGEDEIVTNQEPVIETLPTSDADLTPTGEHIPDAVLELSNSDLLDDDVTDRAQARQPKDGPTLAATPRSRSEPPQGVPVPGVEPYTAPPPGVDPMAATMAPQPRPAYGEPFGDESIPTGEEPADPLEDAPTRVEREEDIRGSFTDAPPAQVNVPRVVIIGGNNRGREYPLKMGDNSIGRGVDNDVILADIAVSRKHTLICFEHDQYVVRDLGSGNGTLLNGKRVESHPLRDGDQLELGNSLLRFLCPVPEMVEPANVGAIAKLETVVTPREMVEDPRHTADVPPMAVHTAHVDQATHREPRSKKARTMKLVVFGAVGLVVLFSAMIGIKLLLASKKSQQSTVTLKKKPARPPDEVAAQEFQEGTTQYRNRNWEKARLHFLKVLKLAPTFDQAKHYADQAAMEISAQNSLNRAKNSLSAKDYAAARSELAKIPSTSVYAGDARIMKQKVDNEQLSKLLDTAKALKSAGDTEAALAKVKDARDISPTNQAVLDLYAELTKEDRGAKKRNGRVQRPRHHRATPRAHPRPQHREPKHAPSIKVSGTKAKAAINLYKKKQWGQAYREAKEYAASLKGRRKRSAESLAEAIRLVGQSWNRADNVGKPSVKIKYYKQAMANDRKIQRGHHQKTLNALIAKAATTEATNALSRGKHTAAYAAVKIAEKHGGRDRLLAKVKSSLEKKAMQLFTRGYTMRGSNIAQARRMWQQVLRMVPPTSKAYQKAYTWLNNSTPTYQDEDED